MEIMCYIYSENDGVKINSWNISKQMEALAEYKMRKEKNEMVGYLEGPSFPLDRPDVKYNSLKKVFEIKTDREMVESGQRILKKYEKIILNSIVNKELKEIYDEGLILNNQYEIVFKIDNFNNLKRKNIIELLQINFSEKEIRDAILEKLIVLLDSKYNQLTKKYPNFEILNFNYKITMAHNWNLLSEPSKLRIIRSDDRLEAFNVLLAEFYSSLTDEQKKDEQFILNKLNNLSSLIIEKEKIYKDNYNKLIEMRNYFTDKLRNMVLNENSINSFLEEVNAFYGEQILKSDEIELSNKYYSTIPFPNLNIYN